ncbi:hypothetical protein [Dialister sp.]|uniref:hypothetical protein n=1 Tax=Dialister sp. TaxID=1955814 RepID=UPI002E80A326|nr:hypothetical protein [Dialister sp.]MEE3452296.1 hypothetical protein [Dialister sp.]
MNDMILTEEGLKAAKQTIEVLKGTVEALQVNLSQERDNNEGLNLTVEALQDENGRLQEKIFQLEAELQTAKNSVPEISPVMENGEDQELLENLGSKLGYYYKDLKQLDDKKLTAEDSETLYNILDYTFKALKKAGVKL